MAGHSNESAKYRVLLVHSGIGPGGAPIYLANLIQQLHEDGRFSISVIARPSGAVPLLENAGADVTFIRRFPTFRHTTAGGHSIFDLRFYGNWLYGKLVQKWWREFLAGFHADIIHLGSITLVPLVQPANHTGSKVVISVQETVLPGKWGIRKRWIARQLSRYAHAVLHISEYDKKKLGCQSPIVEVIPNWVDLRVFSRDIPGDTVRSELGLAASQKLIITLGGATEVKGTLDFLRAAKLLKSYKDYVFAIAGLAPSVVARPTLQSRAKRELKRLLRIDYKDRLYEFIKANSLEDNVLLLGHRDDIPAVLAACDVLVFPAIRGHQARPVLEAGAMGKPVIATDFECIAEYVQHNVNGLLVPSSAPSKLKEALIELLETPGLAARLGEANYKVSTTFHNRDINGPKIVQVYERLLRIAEQERDTNSLDSMGCR